MPRSVRSGSDSSEVDERIAALADWRGELLSRMRRLIREAVPDVVEAVKWRKPSNPSGVPTWSRGGLICTGEVYRDKVKLTFAKGAEIGDPAGLFNSGLDGGVRRAIDLREGDRVDEEAFKELVRRAAALASSKGRAARGGEAGAPSGEPRLLSGGNPQIPKGDGNAPVQAYIDAMPGWKRDVGRRLDALVERTVPEVRKAVRWNSPFYGVEGRGWFMSYHCFTRYVKITFFRGTSLRPVPPVGSRDPEARYFHIHEGEAFDEALLAGWIGQAAAIPGWIP